MRKKYRLLSLLLAILLAAAMFVSCVSDGENGETSNSAGTLEDQPNDIPDAVDLAIILNGATDCKVVRADGLEPANAQVIAASDIRNAIGDVTGVIPKIGTDYTKDGTYESSTIEILVGITNYTESETTLSRMSYGEYVIKVVGNKLVVAAYSDAAIRVAANQLIKRIKELAVYGEGVNENDPDAKKNLIIPKDFLLTDTVDTGLAALPAYDGGKYLATYMSGGEGKQIIIKDTNAEQYQEYLKKLEANDYTEYTATTMKDNYFATYNNEKYTVNVGFYKYENSARIIIENLAPAVGLEADNIYTEVTTSQITALGVAYTDSDGSYTGNGLSILIRLKDGRFIVIDGGFKRAVCANNLLKAMKEQSSGYLKTGEKITVAAWIITHSHSDHNGMINGYSDTFSGVTVEKFLLNFMAESERQKAMAQSMSEGEGGGYKTTLSVAAKLGATVHTVRVGQIFYFADIKVEVLYTVDSYGPLLCEAINTTSIIMKMTFGDGTVYMSTGDATGMAMQIAAKTFEDYLKSDIVQLAHHGGSTGGLDGGTIAAYRYMLPSFLLCPSGLAPYYEKNRLRSYNAVLFLPSEGGINPNYKEALVSGDQGDYIIMPIPYALGSAIIKRAS